MQQRIAVLEDNVDCRQILGILLEPEYLVHGFADVASLQTALDADSYDLLIVDLLVEGQFAGFDILQYVRSTPELSEIPVILLTGDNVRVNRESAERLGFDGYIVKPFDFDELQEMVSRLLSGGSYPLRASA